MISANELRNVQLSNEANGYSVEEVNGLLDSAASTIDAYVNENKELYRKLELLASKIEEYREEEDSIKSALITAQKIADKITKEAQESADTLKSESEESARDAVAAATSKADELVSEAREYAASMLKEKTEEAEAICSNAEKKANDAINSSKIVAQNILDQAKEISEDLISKSKAEKEAYEILTSALKNNAKDFISKLTALYTEQLEALGGANLERTATEEEKEVDSLQEEVDSLVSEIDEMESAIPTEVSIEEEPEETSEPDEEPEEAEAEKETGEEPETEAEEEIEIVDEEEEEEQNEDEDFEIIKDEEDDEEPADPMKAVEAFSQNEITPIETDTSFIPEIDEEAQMESEEEKSLFDEEESQLPFETYFNVSKDDAHLDRTQTISLVPPEEDDDDDEPKFKGFFGKRK